MGITFAFSLRRLYAARWHSGAASLSRHLTQGRICLRLVQITLNEVGAELRLRRLLCEKALPFRCPCTLTNLLRALWKAAPSRRRGQGKMG
jgi:hypothetical protein